MIKLTILTGGGDGWFRARCPEFDVFGGGETKQAAVESVLKCVGATARFRLSENPNDELAKMVIDHDGPLKELFL